MRVSFLAGFPSRFRFDSLMLFMSFMVNFPAFQNSVAGFGIHDKPGELRFGFMPFYRDHN
jgi:hypothetical protein